MIRKKTFNQILIFQTSVYLCFCTFKMEYFGERFHSKLPSLIILYLFTSPFQLVIKVLLCLKSPILQQMTGNCGYLDTFLPSDWNIRQTAIHKLQLFTYGFVDDEEN